ncbi:MAG: PAS domain S-box protein [Fimbriimonadia bacterium]|nr:PAS domain S-box protein [Fimbriimonadia bacterium]
MKHSSNEPFSALFELFQGVNQSDLPELHAWIEKALQRFMELLQADSGVVFLREDKTGKVYLAAHSATEPEFIELLQAGVDIAELPFVSATIQDRRVLMHNIDDYPPDTLMGDNLRKYGYRRALLTPLVEHARVYGIIAFGFKYEKELSDIEIQALSLLGYQLGSALNQRELMKQLQSSEKMYRSMVEGLNLFLWEFDPQTQTVTYISPQASNCLGYTTEELKQDTTWDKIISPPDRQRIRAMIQRALETGEGYDAEYQATTASGQKVWFHTLVSVEQQEEGYIFRGVTLDITARKQQEEQWEKIQAASVQQERLRALGQMAGAIAHDFNNALMRVMGGLELIDIEHPLTEKQQHYLEMVRTAVIDASEMVARLREFYRQQPIKEGYHSTHLKAMIDEVITLTQPIWHTQSLMKGITIEINTDLDPALSLPASATEMREVITNLIFNAVDAMPQGGILTLKAFQEESEAVITVSDTGIGMSEETRLHCFEPFYTTKNESGSGLGLAVVYGIVKRMQGDITVNSILGEGTTFTIRLPIQKAETPSAPSAESNPLKPSVILLVEDEDQIRETLTDMLRFAGHQTHAMGSAKEALEWLSDHQPDIILTDQGLPGMSGTQFAMEAKKRYPHVGIALITGWGDTLTPDTPGLKAIDTILSKPTRRQALLEALAEISQKKE